MLRLWAWATIPASAMSYTHTQELRASAGELLACSCFKTKFWSKHELYCFKLHMYMMLLPWGVTKETMKQTTFNIACFLKWAESRYIHGLRSDRCLLTEKAEPSPCKPEEVKGAGSNSTEQQQLMLVGPRVISLNVHMFREDSIMSHQQLSLLVSCSFNPFRAAAGNSRRSRVYRESQRFRKIA